MPSQLISQAIQEAAFGATIQLGPGIHILSAPLSLKSGITLAGVGRATVVFLDAKREGPAISSDDPALHDVTIRNLMIEAGTLQAPGRDPNQDRRPLATQLVPERGGIGLIVDATQRMRRITFERVTIRNATLSAVEIFGADGITVEECGFSASGGAVTPGA